MSRPLGLLLTPLLLCACVMHTRSLLIANSDVCAHVEHHGPLSYDIPVRLSQCFGTQNQEWTVKDGTFVNRANLCLSVEGNRSENFTPVIAAQCTGSPGQQWQVSGSHVVGLGGKCLDVAGGDVADGSQLVLNACGAAASQQWLVQ